ncbi:Fumarylacetoacetate hydrolase domain-containing protein [Desulfonema limicola]|uniref:Fumarylacetoacetate hydrolase domain-containing protein n=1 Tax=Desulfonema limicola TaxID=45656 RepID=A0A975BE73_9BACT|nr:fumarylacetoacetate hydrolase family protein [Desulfonema limicola]QTA83693.1 Fumarylacetoacetate hydrolase domain-containing protein [Desulfonema limicola]
MKLVRFGEKGKEKPGIFHKEGIIDLRAIFPEIPDIGEKFFAQGWFERVLDIKESDMGKNIINPDVRLGPPVFQPSKIICLGKNYAEHAKEGGFDMPKTPLLFCKTPNTISGPFDPILMPQSSGQLDWEVELAVVMAKKGKTIAKARAFDYIAGYMVMNDVSARKAQFADSQWFRGKSFDTFAPIGPVLATRDEIDDIKNLRLEALVNGVVMQDGNTCDMIFEIPSILENISQDITLYPGDIISTGTPSGVGIFRDPPIVLQPGDIVECRIENIGAIKNQCVSLS